MFFLNQFFFWTALAFRLGSARSLSPMRAGEADGVGRSTSTVWLGDGVDASEAWTGVGNAMTVGGVP